MCADGLHFQEVDSTDRVYTFTNTHGLAGKLAERRLTCIALHGVGRAITVSYKLTTLNLVCMVNTYIMAGGEYVAGTTVHLKQPETGTRAVNWWQVLGLNW